MENETQIINRLINLIMSRSEFASQNVLNSILEFAMKNGYIFNNLDRILKKL